MTKWTDEKIKEGILEAVKGCGLDRMPSKNEVKAFYNDSALANAISRRPGGWYKLAQELGLPIKDSETYFGKKYERLVQEELITRGYEVRMMPQNYPYDLFVDDTVKVDVKASKLYNGAQSGFYSFNVDKPFCTCDIYVLLLLADDGAVIGALIIPSKDVATNTKISVGGTKSRYSKYLDRWDFIERYNQFFQSVS